ncbi:MAG: NAD-dependent epimerase/dehydratase family protein [Pseudomonadota bacterium]
MSTLSFNSLRSFIRTGRYTASTPVSSARQPQRSIDIPIGDAVAVQRHLIVGTGPVGRAVARALLRRGISAQFISRSLPSRPTPGTSTHAIADATDVKALRPWLDGATAVYHCAQPQNAKWEHDYAELTVALAKAAAELKVPLLMPQSTEAVGQPWAAVITNRHPVAPTTRRGRVMAKVAAGLFAMRSTHGLQFSLVRAGDSFGPGVTSGVLGEAVFRSVLRGKRAWLVGNAEASRSFNYIDDFGETLVLLAYQANKPEFWGRDWIAPQLGPLTPSQFSGFLRHAFGQNIRTTQLGRAELFLHCAFDRTAREAFSRYYMYGQNYILDGSDLQNRLQQKPTSMLEALTNTLAWYRRHEKAT